MNADTQEILNKVTTLSNLRQVTQSYPIIRQEELDLIKLVDDKLKELIEKL